MPSTKQRITTIKIDEDLWKNVRKCAIDNDITLSKFITNALRNELEKYKP